MIRLTLISITLISCLQSCSLREKELELQKKENDLNKREQALIVRENNLKLREEEFANKLMADSLSTDSSFYNNAIIGNWDARMVCTEATCPGSAVGDSKTETWQINYEGKIVVAKAKSGNQLIRIYTGTYTGNTLELIEERPTTTSDQATKMVVRLRLTNNSTMEGQRDILRSDCKVIYTLNLTKQTAGS